MGGEVPVEDAGEELLHGSARVVDADGDGGVYQGPLDADRKAHGKGFMRYNDGRLFCGEFLHGSLLHGALYTQLGQAEFTMYEGIWASSARGALRVDRAMVQRFPFIMSQANKGPLCPSGHPLVDFLTPVANGRCDICEAKQPRGVPMSGCRTCNYDVCRNCSVAIGLLVAQERKRQLCPSGHLLVALLTPVANGICDVCKARQPRGAPMLGCRACNFDVCRNCTGVPVAAGASLEPPCSSSFAAKRCSPPQSGPPLAAAPREEATVCDLDACERYCGTPRPSFGASSVRRRLSSKSTQDLDAAYASSGAASIGAPTSCVRKLPSSRSPSSLSSKEARESESDDNSSSSSDSSSTASSSSSSNASMSRRSTSSSGSESSSPESQFRQVPQRCARPLYGMSQRRATLRFGERPERTAKGKVVTELLCRWWYVLPDWPPDDEDYYRAELNRLSLRRVRVEEWEWAPKIDKNGFHKVYELSQFRGLFRNSSGQLYDLRPRDTCPCFNNLFKKDIGELLQLLTLAYQNQLADLNESKCDESKLEAKLRSRLEVVQRRARSPEVRRLCRNRGTKRERVEAEEPSSCAKRRASDEEGAETALDPMEQDWEEPLHGSARVVDTDGDGGVYKGPLDAEREANGIGFMRYDDGRLFCGEFLHGSLLRGTLYTQLGEVEFTMNEGLWTKRARGGAFFVDRALVHRFPFSMSQEEDDDDAEEEPGAAGCAEPSEEKEQPQPVVEEDKAIDGEKEEAEEVGREVQAEDEEAEEPEQSAPVDVEQCAQQERIASAISEARMGIERAVAAERAHATVLEATKEVLVASQVEAEQRLAAKVEMRLAAEEAKRHANALFLAATRTLDNLPGVSAEKILDVHEAAMERGFPAEMFRNQLLAKVSNLRAVVNAATQDPQFCAKRLLAQAEVESARSAVHESGVALGAAEAAERSCQASLRSVQQELEDLEAPLQEALRSRYRADRCSEALTLLAREGCSETLADDQHEQQPEVSRKAYETLACIRVEMERAITTESTKELESLSRGPLAELERLGGTCIASGWRRTGESYSASAAPELP